MHSFLAVMGGFVVEMKDQPESKNMGIQDQAEGNNKVDIQTELESNNKAKIQSFLPWKSNRKPRTRLTLVPEALIFFKENKELSSLIPKPSLVHIQDKSKGNTLAKALVCLQGKYSTGGDDESSSLDGWYDC